MVRMLAGWGSIHDARPTAPERYPRYGPAMTAWSTAGTTRRALGAALLTGVLAVGTAGCGSSDDDQAASTAASAPAATTTAKPPSDTTATASDVTPKADGATPEGADAMPTATEPPATTAVTPPPTTTATTPPTSTVPAAKPPATPTRSTGSATDQTAVRRTVDRYMRAFVAGDGATVCGLLDDRQRRLLGSRGAGTCEQATETAQKAVASDATIRKALKALRVTEVSVEGDRAVAAATVATNGRDSAFPITLSRTDGGWRISSNAPAGG
jgi:hypothetical protein